MSTKTKRRATEQTAEESRSSAPEVAKNLKIYLDAVKRDPSMRVSVTAAARRCGVHRDTIYEHKEHPAVAPLLEELIKLRVRRRQEKADRKAVVKIEASEEALGAPAASSAEGPTDRSPLAPGMEVRELSDDQFEARIHAAIQGVTDAMLRFIGHRRSDRDAKDVVRVAWELDETVKQLYAHAGRLATLADEAKRRHRMLRGLASNPLPLFDSDAPAP